MINKRHEGVNQLEEGFYLSDNHLREPGWLILGPSKQKVVKGLKYLHPSFFGGYQRKTEKVHRCNCSWWKPPQETREVGIRAFKTESDHKIVKGLNSGGHQKKN